MRAMRWIAASGLFLAAGAAWAGPGLPPGHDDVVYPDDAAGPAAPRRVDVTITDQGPRPRDIQVSGGEELELVLTRASPNACRFDVVVDGQDLRTPVPAGHPVALTVRAEAPGDVHLSCPREDVVGVADVR